jgi:DNA-binding NtrC family response regulator|tara:strand:- start:180 stop:530 length:351 start_codon:yes stop_codon:yes gene_type:complete
MTFKKKHIKYLNKSKKYSLLKILRKENKITPEFEVILSSLSLEDIIALKLELAASTAHGALYGLPIWKSLPTIIQEALTKFSISACSSKTEAASFLGISRAYLKKLVKKYKIEEKA